MCEHKIGLTILGEAVNIPLFTVFVDFQPYSPVASINEVYDSLA